MHIIEFLFGEYYVSWNNQNLVMMVSCFLASENIAHQFSDEFYLLDGTTS